MRIRAESMRRPLPGDEWRPIPSLGGDFEASSSGRIRRVRGARNARGRCLAQREIANNPGYLVVSISHSASGRSPAQECVHRLVAEAFHGPPPDDRFEVNHRNKVKWDNRPENLEWVSRSENLRYSGVSVGERNSQAVLNEGLVRSIRADHRSGLGYKRLGAKYGVCCGTARDVVKRRTWAHVS